MEAWIEYIKSRSRKVFDDKTVDAWRKLAVLVVEHLCPKLPQVQEPLPNPKTDSEEAPKAQVTDVDQADVSNIGDIKVEQPMRNESPVLQLTDFPPHHNPYGTWSELTTTPEAIPEIEFAAEPTAEARNTQEVTWELPPEQLPIENTED